MLMVKMNQCLVSSTAQFSTSFHSMDRWAVACEFKAEKKNKYFKLTATFCRQSELAQTTSMTCHQTFFDLDLCFLFYYSSCWMKKKIHFITTNAILCLKMWICIKRFNEWGQCPHLSSNILSARSNCPLYYSWNCENAFLIKIVANG